ncbi:hypothetical protein OG229_02380 [Streptomyces platensis]|uniref:hypothetical protein n=1 Tax=Streptomyces platensis TaxID=58346 RepID=UPI002E124B9A|nr:hypothetical protein OG229_02380 [Streptomyces platensis]
MSITTHYDFEVSPGDEVGTDATLFCCNQRMTVAGPDKHGDRTHTCGNCGAQVDVNKLGLLGDIRD